MNGIYELLKQNNIPNLQYYSDRLKHSVFVGDNNRWVFVETPKCACSSIKRTLIELEGKSIDFRHVGMESTIPMSIHSREINPISGIETWDKSSILDLFNNQNIPKFCIVRNPYARLASAWADKIRQREPGYIRLIKPINEFNKNKDLNSTPSFSDFVNWLTKKNKPDHCNYHWASMKALLLPQIVNYDHVIKTENLSEELPMILNKIFRIDNSDEYLKKFKLNESLYIDWRSLYTNEIAQKVFEFYKLDFEYYEYDKESWISTPIQDSVYTHKLEKTALQAISNRNETIHYLLTNQKVSPDEVNFIRDLSLSLVETDPNSALKLMLIAQKFRPNGNFINKKVEEIRNIVDRK